MSDAKPTRICDCGYWLLDKQTCPECGRAFEEARQMGAPSRDHLLRVLCFVGMLMMVAPCIASPLFILAGPMITDPASTPVEYTIATAVLGTLVMSPIGVVVLVVNAILGLLRWSLAREKRDALKIAIISTVAAGVWLALASVLITM